MNCRDFIMKPLAAGSYMMVDLSDGRTYLVPYGSKESVSQFHCVPIPSLIGCSWYRKEHTKVIHNCYYTHNLPLKMPTRAVQQLSKKLSRPVPIRLQFHISISILGMRDSAWTSCCALLSGSSLDGHLFPIGLFVSCIKH
jgi:hypothetical protein